MLLQTIRPRGFRGTRVERWPVDAWQLVRFGPPETAFRRVTLADPVPQAGEVLIDVEASGLNFADVVARSGAYRDCPPLPCILGYEVVGRVSALGPEVAGPRIGARVIAFTRFGGYASRVVAAALGVMEVPETMPAAEAAALAVQGATAWYMAEDLIRLHPGEHVLVQAAAGGVGSILVQIAKARGCIVYGTASSTEKLEFMSRLGVDHPILYTSEDFELAVRRIQGQDYRGLDVVFDSLGGQAYAKARRLLAAGGRLVCFGAADATTETRSLRKLLGLALGFGLTSPISWLMRSQSLIGVNMLRIADQKPQTMQRCLAGISALWTSGRLKLRSGGEFDAARIAEAHRALGGRGTIGKVVLRWH